jgi:hypothetical protein
MTPLEFGFALEHELATRGAEQFVLVLDAVGDGRNFIARVGFAEGDWRDFDIELPVAIDLGSDWESAVLGAVSLAASTETQWIQ